MSGLSGHFAAGKIHWLWKHKTEIRQKLVQWIKVFVKELRIWMKHVKAQERPVKKSDIGKIKEWRYSGQNTALMYL